MDWRDNGCKEELLTPFVFLSLKYHELSLFDNVFQQ